MDTYSDISSKYTSEVKKPTAAKKTYKPYFYAGSLYYANINIDPDIIQRLNITAETELTEEIVQEGILLKRFNIKNRNGRPEVLPTQLDDQDYGE